MVRIAVFGSFYRGHCLLDALLNGPHAQQFKLVGVATDDVGQAFASGERRVWQYPHQAWEERMVMDLAGRHGLPLHTGRVNTESFRRTLREDWRPDLCVAATFGQRIDAPLYNTPPLGFYNLHPCVQGAWSERAPLPPGATVVDVHKLSSPVAAHFAVNALRRIVERARRAALSRRLERAAASVLEPAFEDTRR